MAGIKNGDLLVNAAGSFDVFLTVDLNLAFQQYLSTLPLPIIVLKSTSAKLEDLSPLIPQLLNVLQTFLDKTIYSVEA